jgi:penicillin V acylase-like amidase (Ntn superfamily)
MYKQTQRLLLLPVLYFLGGASFFLPALFSSPVTLPAETPATNLSVELFSPAAERIPARPRGACSAFCLNDGGHCVYGANMDNTIEIGLLFVNKRQVLKTTWDPSTSGEYARWISGYGSVTVDFVGYQMAWAGMNEAGLMISTMSMPETQGPFPDERPPFEGPFWMQYQLDTHSTVEQVIASDAEIRPAASAVDHYLVCDRTGTCAVVEFISGKMVSHTGESLPVKALTNNPYDDSVAAMEESLRSGGRPDDNSLWRFATAAERLKAFQPSDPNGAVAYAFDTLEAVSREDTAWSFVFDPVNFRVHFRTNNNPRIRYVDLSSLDFSCGTPVKSQDVFADFSGDVGGNFTDYTHAAGFAHSTRFFAEYGGMSMSPFVVDTLLWGLESFPCRAGEISTSVDLERYHPLLPPTAAWAGLTIVHRAGPIWLLLVVLSLAVVIWRMTLDKPSPLAGRLVWALATVILGPLGLLIYLLDHRKKHREEKP